jgi:hypothetical protein
VRPQLRFELNQDEFRGCAKSHGRTPSAGATRGVNQETAETLQPLHERSVDARGDPGPRSPDGSSIWEPVVFFLALSPLPLGAFYMSAKLVRRAVKTSDNTVSPD